MIDRSSARSPWSSAAADDRAAADASREDLSGLFGQVLGSTQAAFGARIEAMVKGIVPDGRGLQPSRLDPRAQRIAQLNEAADQVRTERRDALRAAADDREYDSERRMTTRERTKVLERDAQGDKERLSRPTSSAERTVAPRPMEREGLPSAPPRSEGRTDAQATSRDTPRPVHPASPTGDATSTGDATQTTKSEKPVFAADAATSASAMASTGPAASASNATEAGSAAQQIGEILGAKPIGARSDGAQSPAVPADPKGQAERGTEVKGKPTLPHRPPGRAASTDAARPTGRAAFQRLVRALRMNVGPRESTAKLNLRPPELGRVRIDVRMVDQRMNLLIRTETPEAHAALGARVNGLREALAQHGVVIERLEMPLPPPAHPDALPPPDQDGSQPQPDGSAMHSGDDNGSRTAQHESRENDDWPPALSVADDAEAVGDLRLDIRV